MDFNRGSCYLPLKHPFLKGSIKEKEIWVDKLVVLSLKQYLV